MTARNSLVEPAACEPAARPSVLIVDDVEANTIALETLLSDLDCDVVTARNGSDALRALLKRQFALMLLDVQMPEMDGYEVARHARSNRSTREVPVIFLTAANETEDRLLRGYGSGAVDFLFKPVNPVVLRSKVRIFLELFESRAEIARRKQELEGAYRELKNTQAQLVQSAKMASLGQLVAGVAHEINNPLTFALSHLVTARRCLREVAPELATLSEEGTRTWQRANDRLQEMNVGLERVRDLVVKLRTFSRLDEGEWKRVSMRENIEAVLTIFNPRIEGRVHVDITFAEPEEIECYPGPLNQAVTNLVANTLDAMEGVEGRLTIFAGARGGFYEISIRDNGAGLPEANRERLFEPFFTTKPAGAGTGLGLSITYGIVTKHGGEIELTDAPAGGAIATIRLPLSQAKTPRNS